MTGRRALAVALATVALVVSACGGDDTDATSTAQSAAGSPESEIDDTVQSGDETSTTATGTGETSASGTERRPGCEAVPEAADGVYAVSDAGEIEITADGTSVNLVEARPAEGWTATGDAEDDTDEVEVHFRRDGREVEFEAELDDGRLDVEICDR